jgi:hypothetical protein
VTAAHRGLAYVGVLVLKLNLALLTLTVSLYLCGWCSSWCCSGSCTTEAQSERKGVYSASVSDTAAYSCMGFCFSKAKHCCLSAVQPARVLMRLASTACMHHLQIQYATQKDSHSPAVGASVVLALTVGSAVAAGLAVAVGLAVAAGATGAAARRAVVVSTVPLKWLFTPWYTMSVPCPAQIVCRPYVKQRCLAEHMHTHCALLNMQLAVQHIGTGSAKTSTSSSSSGSEPV